VRLFQNLIGNAVKFRREEPLEIHIAASQSEEGWLISVQDNGTAIDMNSADRVFQIFQRLHSREKYEGTGIGLAICRKIVEQHGGRIWLESEMAKGTTFYFTLPAGGATGRGQL
jgi:chemotaxis family two-component system sensor kinase Cph1